MTCYTFLMVEQTSTLLHESNTQTLRCLKDGAVVLAAARSGNVLGS